LEVCAPNINNIARSDRNPINFGTFDAPYL
jgi:hypothetical protein